MTGKYLNPRFVSMILLAVLLATISCGARHFQLTKEQVEERVKRELPIGATQEQVKQFISSFKAEFEVEERDYETGGIPNIPYADNSETSDQTHHGIIRARIRKIGRDPKNFALFDLHLEFYFDEKGLLVGHKLETYGYH